MMHESPSVGDSEVILSEAPDNSKKKSYYNLDFGRIRTSALRRSRSH